MKATCTIKTYTGSLCRIFVTPSLKEGQSPRVEAVAADFPTGRVPAFIVQMIVRVPAIAKHLRKIEVDGFNHGRHLGYVLPVEGILALAKALQATRPRNQATADATQNLCRWFTNHLIPAMEGLAVAQQTQDNLTSAAPTPKHKLTISTNTTEFSISDLDLDEDRIFIEIYGCTHSISPRAVFEALGLL